MPIGGLSPLARGTLDRTETDLLINRFIPAGAGNTSMLEASLLVGAVYPRWRGEHAGEYGEGALMGGLSPLARGTP